MIASTGMPARLALPMNANGRSGLNTVVSPPISRASPRTAVKEPSVTMNGGRPTKAIRAPLRKPKNRPVISAAGMPSSPQPAISEQITAAIADAARIEPTDRSMPPVRMTKVMPAASTVLIDACCATIEMFCGVKNRPSDR